MAAVDPPSAAGAPGGVPARPPAVPPPDPPVTSLSGAPAGPPAVPPSGVPVRAQSDAPVAAPSGAPVAARSGAPGAHAAGPARSGVTMPVSLGPTRRGPSARRRPLPMAPVPGGLCGSDAPADLGPLAEPPSADAPPADVRLPDGERSPDAPVLLAGARRALLVDRRQLTLDQIAALAALPDGDVPALAELAHAVRLDWCGDTVEIEGILSAKTGGCPEDCQFCAQSSRFESTVKAVPLLGHDEVLAAARETAAVGASEFCLVYAVRGPDERLMAHLEEVVPLVGRETGLQVAVSAGIVDDDQARRLAAAGTHRYNHNLETARSHFTNIVTTHTWDERFETCRLVREHGMELCCGVLLGMGESAEQRIELLGQLRDVGPAEVPLNFLNPRPGTPLADRPLVGAVDAIRWIALFRLALPDVILRYAGGREVTLGDLQALGLEAGINSLIVGNYLTTLGRSPEEDLAMLRELRMPIGALSKVI
ncbi:MAG TPA: biotin synthase BioB [Acidimicrobiales bacterium]|nr:biotin synthase BioB [Acidimicrobiales bacterium]